jgi:hypothetical protein
MNDGSYISWKGGATFHNIIDETTNKADKVPRPDQTTHATQSPTEEMHVQHLMDDLRVILSISPWTIHVLDNWPRPVHYQWMNISVALYNIVFAYCMEECKTFIREYYGHGRAALIELQQQMAQITP